MANENTTYVKILDAEKLVKRSKVVSDRTISADKASADVWAQTAIMVHEYNPLDKFDATKDAKALAEDIRTAFKKNFEDAYGELPKRDVNGRTGNEESMDGGKKGFKWSSWAGTYLSINYCSQLAHIVKAGIVSQVIDDRGNGAYRVMNKSAAIKAAREALKETQGESENPETEAEASPEVPSDPMDIIRQALKAIEDNLNELTNPDDVFDVAGDLQAVYEKADAMTEAVVDAIEPEEQKAA